MPTLSEQEPRRQFQKSPEGTFKFLEQNSGTWGIPEGKAWFSKDMSPFLAIGKEEVCEETGGSCMAFCLVKSERKDLLVIQGHITNNDEIVFLYKYVVTKEKDIPHTLPQEPNITEAMSEIRAIVPPPKQNQHAEG